MLLDLSVPRNLDPTIGRQESIFLYDIDDVQTLVNAHYAARIKELDRAEKIIADWVQIVWSRTSDGRARDFVGSLKQGILPLSGRMSLRAASGAFHND
ncbi:MAG: hypothetical protein HY644_00605 [Acidobacteria bacterium]|nr:hypothetical protein [Acidobacteriota bacterium]